jgi:hypothetical protein
VSSERVADLLQQAAELTREAAHAAEEGDLGLMNTLEAHSAQLRREAQRVARRSQRPRASVDAGARLSARAQAITALSEMEVPAPAREIAAYHAARFEQPLDVRALASIRRDERKAWERSQAAHPVYLAPALETRFFRPVRGPLTLSTWPMEQRLIGSSSARVDHLRLAMQIAETADKLSGTAAAEAVAKLAWRYALSIPGATDPGKTAKPTQIAAAARAELELVASQDEEERTAGARRALAQLSEAQQLWGQEHGLQLVAEAGAR